VPFRMFAEWVLEAHKDGISQRSYCKLENRRPATYTLVSGFCTPGKILCLCARGARPHFLSAWRIRMDECVERTKEKLARRRLPEL
jgi:hypothetical protein